jgi:phosphocarrier protein HPr
MSMRSTRIVVVTNPQGLHARPADLFVKTATRFASKIELVKGRERVDGKSILSLLTLAAVEGTQLSIEADGPDAEQALDALAKLVEQNFAENEHVHE